MKKKLFVLTLTLAAATFAGCGGEKVPETSSNDATVKEEVQETRKKVVNEMIEVTLPTGDYTVQENDISLRVFAVPEGSLPSFDVPYISVQQTRSVAGMEITNEEEMAQEKEKHPDLFTEEINGVTWYGWDEDNPFKEGEKLCYWHTIVDKNTRMSVQVPDFAVSEPWIQEMIKSLQVVK
ncbi:MAG: hypothetical protein Q4P30_05930 [Eubacteriales bacterium]|nr:hypothetical protein [Eubacteriales bacterium]